MCVVDVHLLVISILSMCFRNSNRLTICTVDGRSVYVKNLPLNITAQQLEEAFAKIGPVKANGVNVKSQKVASTAFQIVNLTAQCLNFFT